MQSQALHHRNGVLGEPQPELLMASMRAGAREFLSGAIAPTVLADALLRAAARRAEHTTKKTRGKVLMFWGAKGGSGVTTLATNFAIALHNETGGEVVLADLNPQLGDVAVLLGLTPRFTIAEAFLNPNRLDQEFVSTLVCEHRSGISVLAAPDSYTSASIDERSVGLDQPCESILQDDDSSSGLRSHGDLRGIVAEPTLFRLGHDHVSFGDLPVKLIVTTAFRTTEMTRRLADCESIVFLVDHDPPEVAVTLRPEELSSS